MKRFLLTSLMLLIRSKLACPGLLGSIISVSHSSSSQTVLLSLIFDAAALCNTKNKMPTQSNPRLYKVPVLRATPILHQCVNPPGCIDAIHPSNDILSANTNTLNKLIITLNGTVCSTVYKKYSKLS